MENNSKMSLIIKIILIFFFVLGLGMAGFFYFYYQTNILKVAKTGIQIEKDDDFDKIVDELKEEDKNKENEGSAIVKNNCFIDGVLVKNGESKELFSRSIVNPYEDCNNFKKKRVCDNGFLLGDDIYRYSECIKKMDCELPDGTIVKNGQKLMLYSRSRVAYNKRGENCEKYGEMRKCQETVLSGSDEFVYRQCRVSYDNSCKLLNGKVIADNQSFPAYKKNRVSWEEDCNSKDNMKIFICSKTEISGGDLSQYPYTNCQRNAPKNCNLILNTPEGKKEKVSFRHNETDIPLFSRGYRTDQHSCGWYENDFKCIDGEMDGGDYSLDEYSYVRCYEN